MYTQCPECSTAFRVTAEVLRQAAGKVRCGGCGNAFNALEHLSEEKPANPRATSSTREIPREIGTDAGHIRPAGAPEALAPGAAVRETQDDQPENGVLPPEAENGNVSLLDAELAADLESRRVDEVLAESHTPLDEVLTADGDAAIDSPEVFAEDAGKTVPDDELRFDDNTGLPDDYGHDVDADDDRESAFVVPEPSRDAPQPMASLNIDLGFDDPGEWQDLLDEVEPRAEGPADDSGERTFAEELEALDLGDVDDADEVDEAPGEAASRMEALSIELSGIHQELGEISSPATETTIIDELEALDVDLDADGDELEALGVDLDTDGDEFDVGEETATTDTDTESEPRHGETTDEDHGATAAHEDSAEDSGAPDDTDAAANVEAGTLNADEAMDDGDRRETALDVDAADIAAAGHDDDAEAEAPTVADLAPTEEATDIAASDTLTPADVDAGSDAEAVVVPDEACTEAAGHDDQSSDDVSTVDAGEFRTDEIASYIAAAEAGDATKEAGDSTGTEGVPASPLHGEDAADAAAGDDGEQPHDVDDSPVETGSQTGPGEDDAAATCLTSDEDDDDEVQHEPEDNELDARADDERASADDDLSGDGAGVIELILANDDIDPREWNEADDAGDEAADNELAAFEIALEDETTATAASDEPSIDDDLFAAAFESETDKPENTPAEPVLTPMSEEEQTINMMIDQELLAVAVTDEDGLASTIVGSKESFDAAIAAVEAEEQAAGQKNADLTVETIIMSGETTESLRDLARSEALKEEAAALIAAAKAEEQTLSKASVNWKLTGALVGLGILLLLQAIHFSRDTLARVPAFRAVLGPVYEAVGKPLAPAWEVTGWRVEKTNGSVNAAGDTLSIYTEVGNRSGAPLPYPVIGVSLLDRFEESLGSRIFEPEEYLPGDVDRRGVVETGVSFNARMQIESPAVAASGFRLNVCYREDGESLRCAIEDFR